MTDENARRRASRHIRPKSPRPLRLTERDKLVVKAINDFRVMRQQQVQRLLFPSKNTAQDRLRRLWEHAYIKREWLPSVGGIQTTSVLYLLDRRGVELLRREFGYGDTRLRWSAKKPSPLFLEHTLGLSEIRLAVELACRAHAYPLTVWRDEKAVKADYDRVQLGKQWVPVLPDAHFVIEVPAGELHFFVEYDRGREDLKVFKKKLAAYIAYYRSPKCAARYGTNKIRLLSVAEGGTSGSGRTRLDNLTQLARDLNAGRQFWFSALKQVAAEDMLTAPIWQVTFSSELAALTSKE